MTVSHPLQFCGQVLILGLKTGQFVLDAVEPTRNVETQGWSVGKRLEFLVAGLGRVPNHTDVSADKVEFSSDPDFGTGSLVQVSATGGGLTAGTDYFVRNELLGVYSFHPSEADARAGTNRVDLSGAITATVIPGGSYRRVEGVSVAPYQQGPTIERMGRSRTDSVDSDGDGLTDREEFFLSTDPSSKDTDLDGIHDRVEYLGYNLGHEVGGDDLGIIKTDPLDADNDKRSDGAEAELADADADGKLDPVNELARWVVRVLGEAPYRVFSNPLVADADFDGVVDGVEFAHGIDPNKGNTDDDKLDDGQEIAANTNPLVEDFRVTVYFNSLSITSEGNGVRFDLSVRLPGSGVAGLSNTLTHVVTEQISLHGDTLGFDRTAQSDVEPYLPDGTGALRNDDNNANGIKFSPVPQTLNLARYVPVAERSFTFGLTTGQSFSVEALVSDEEPGLPFGSNVPYVYLGGIDGVQARRAAAGGSGSAPTERPVFRGSDLLAATSPFIDFTITFAAADNQFWIGDASGGTIAGALSFTIFIG